MWSEKSLDPENKTYFSLVVDILKSDKYLTNNIVILKNKILEEQYFFLIIYVASDRGIFALHSVD